MYCSNDCAVKLSQSKKVVGNLKSAQLYKANQESSVPMKLRMRVHNAVHTHKEHKELHKKIDEAVEKS